MTFFVRSWPNLKPSKLDFGNRYRHLHVINILMIFEQDYFPFPADLRFFIVVQTWCWCFSSTDDWYGALRRSCWCVWYGSCCLWLRESHFNFIPTRSGCSESDSYCGLKPGKNSHSNLLIYNYKDFEPTDSSNYFVIETKNFNHFIKLKSLIFSSPNISECQIIGLDLF